MSITQEQVKKISEKLAKLAPANLEKLVKDSNSILWYMDLLNEIDTSWVEPTISVISKKYNKLKKDIEIRDISPSNLLKCSPQKIIANQIAVNDIMR